jgi:hypothetical protein
MDDIIQRNRYKRKGKKFIIELGKIKINQNKKSWDGFMFSSIYFHVVLRIKLLHSMVTTISSVQREKKEK